MVEPAPMAGCVEEDWQVPLTVRVAAALFVIAGLDTPPPVTEPVTVTTVPAEPIYSAVAFTLPPIKFPVILIVEAPPETFMV